MKRIFLSIFVMFVCSTSYSQVSFGGGISYDLIDNFGLRVLGNAEINDEWKGQVSYSFFFSDWSLDLDAHYKFIEFDTGYEEGYIHPFAGLNINRDTDTNDTELGINVGLNLTFPIEERRFFLEPKLTFGGIGGLVISAGIMF